MGTGMHHDIRTSRASACFHTRHLSRWTDGREVEVLRLIASGLSNIQVSKRLVISRRTVDTHLTSIYSKIGVSSRRAATRYAIEHHLV